MKNIIFVLLFLSGFKLHAGQMPEIKKMQINGVDILWLVDDSFPTFSYATYFFSGASEDPEDQAGLTQWMFDELTSGTNRYAQKEILDTLEFYGVNFNTEVTHEYALLKANGLVKNMRPALMMMCHLIQNANYPDKQLKLSKDRFFTGLQNMVANHSALADRAFRSLIFSGTNFDRPVSGTMKSVKNITSKDLVKQLAHFNKNIKKKIYLAGPSNMDLTYLIKEDCRWDAAAQNVHKKIKVKKSAHKENEVWLVSVPNANQAQIRLGQFLENENIADVPFEEFYLAYNYLGGGFTSEIITELRVNHGLIYSGGAVVGLSQDYGRSIITTATQNTTLVKALEEIDKLLIKNINGIEDQKFAALRKKVKGQYLFNLEATSEILDRIIAFEHQGKHYKQIFNFTDLIDDLKKENMIKAISKAFDTKKNKKLVLGDKSLAPLLIKAGHEVKMIDYKTFL